jgi:hypothetical protein
MRDVSRVVLLVQCPPAARLPAAVACGVWSGRTGCPLPKNAGYLLLTRARILSFGKMDLIGLFQFFKVFDPAQDFLFACLLNLSSQNKFVEDGVHLIEIEDDVKLAHVREVRVQQLNEEVDGFQINLDHPSGYG